MSLRNVLSQPSER
uniref:Uncharacterized protein n=1 Tax=Anguilla anguilla TaxID=7936 RepID=A0A0E9TF89_ANGAN